MKDEKRKWQVATGTWLGLRAFGYYMMIHMHAMCHYHVLDVIVDIYKWCYRCSILELKRKNLWIENMKDEKILRGSKMLFLSWVEIERSMNWFCEDPTRIKYSEKDRDYEKFWYMLIQSNDHPWDEKLLLYSLSYTWLDMPWAEMKFNLYSHVWCVLLYSLNILKYPPHIFSTCDRS